MRFVKGIECGSCEEKKDCCEARGWGVRSWRRIRSGLL